MARTVPFIRNVPTVIKTIALSSPIDALAIIALKTMRWTRKGRYSWSNWRLGSWRICEKGELLFKLFFLVPELSIKTPIKLYVSAFGAVATPPPTPILLQSYDPRKAE